MLNKTQIINIMNKTKGSQIKYAKRQYSCLSNLYDDYLLEKYHASLAEQSTLIHSMSISYHTYQQAFDYTQEPPYIIKANQRLQQNFSLYNLKALFTLYKVHISNLKYLITNYLIKKDSLLQQKFEQIKALNDYDSLLHLITTFGLDLDERTFLYNTAVAMNENDKSFYDIKAVLFNDYQILIHDNIERSL